MTKQKHIDKAREIVGNYFNNDERTESGLSELIAQALKEERRKAIEECAEIVRTYAQDNETIQPSNTGIVNKIKNLNKE